jgi:hypothetical protein
MPQKNCPIVDIRITISAQPEPIALVKIDSDVVDGLDVAGGEGDRQQHEPADDRRVEDRLPDAAGGRHLGLVRLLAHVRRGVVAGLGVHRQQEAQRQHVPPKHPVAEA